MASAHLPIEPPPDAPVLPLSVRFFSNLIGRRSLFVDVAADSGDFLRCALAANPEIEAVAVEPGPGCRERVADLLARRSEGPAAVRFGAGAGAAGLLTTLEDELRNGGETALWIEVGAAEDGGAEELLSWLEGVGWAAVAIDDERGLFRAVEDAGSGAAALGEGRAQTLFCVRAERALDVCFFSHAASLNGAERGLLGAVRYGIRNADLVATVVLPARGPLLDELTALGAACVVREYDWWCDSGTVSEDAVRDRILTSSTTIVEEVVPLLEEVRPGVVLTMSLVIPWGAVAAARLRRPHVWYVTEFGQLDHELHFFDPFAQVIDTVARASDVVLTISEAVRSTLFPGLPTSVCRTVYPYIEIKEPEAAEPRPPLEPERRFRIGNFHTLARGKDQATLVRAVAELVRRGHPVELLLAGGSDREYRQEVEALIREHGLEDRVRIEGFLDDPYPTMRACDALVMGSRCEALGRTALEGALLGRVLIYAAAGGYLETMIDGETGMAYPPSDASALADRIETVLRDPGLAERLGEQAREHVRRMRDEVRPDLVLLPALRAVSRRAVPADRVALPGLRSLVSVRRHLLHQRREAAALRAVQEELQHQIENLLGVSSRVAALEAQVQALEERGGGGQRQAVERLPGRPEVDSTTAEGAWRLERLIHHLQDSIDHLASDGADLRKELAAVVTLLEHRREAGEILPPRPLERPAVPFQARRAVRLAKRLLRPAYRSARSLAGRLRRSLVRRLPNRWGPAPETRDELRLTAGQPERVPYPALSVVVPVDDLPPGEAEALLVALGGQTVTSVEWVLWSRSEQTLEIRDRAGKTISHARGVGAGEIRESLGGAYCVTATAGSGDLPTTWLEVATWSALAEDLPLVRLSCEDGTGRRVRHPGTATPEDGVPADLLVVRRDLWSPEALDVQALRRLAAGRPRVLGRGIRYVGDYEERPDDVEALLPGDAGALVRACGEHLIQARLPPTVVRHTIFPLDEVLPEESVEDSRRTVLILVPFLAIGGAEKLTYDLMRQLEDRYRFVVVTLAPHDPALGNRLADFRRLTPYVYTLGESFLQPLLFSVVSHLILKYEVGTLFNANGTTWFYEALTSLRQRFPAVTIVNQLFDHREGWIEYYDPVVAHCCDVHLATNQAIERTLLREYQVPGAKIRHIPHGIDLEDFRPGDYGADRVRRLREELGVPPGAILVTMAVRMHPQKRPEDFVVLAHQMEEDEELFFLLVGGGPLDGSIDDLVKYYQVRNLRRLGFYTPIADLLAISDVACMMSEYEALPLFILSALAMETPVVATDVGAIGSVLRQGPCGVVVPRVGDLEAFRTAICALKDERYRQELGRGGRRLVEEEFAIEAAAARYAQVFETPAAADKGPS